MLRHHLKEWNRSSFGDLNTKINSLLDDINRSDLAGEIADLTEEEISLKRNDFVILWDLMRKKESLDFQKSRSKWIQQGDSNSRYFHNQMKLRKRKNQITGIQSQNSWIVNPAEVKEHIKDFFANQFKETSKSRPSMGHFDFERLSIMEAISVESEFSLEEIKNALKDCASDKAPGPDGFSFYILKHIWDIVEKDVVDFIWEFHRSGKIVRSLNSIFIVLIPKTTNPVGLNEYRSISLVGVFISYCPRSSQIALSKSYQSSLVLHSRLSSPEDRSLMGFWF